MFMCECNSVDPDETARNDTLFVILVLILNTNAYLDQWTCPDLKME